jgi:hypothetical protein
VPPFLDESVSADRLEARESILGHRPRAVLTGRLVGTFAARPVKGIVQCPAAVVSRHPHRLKTQSTCHGAWSFAPPIAGNRWRRAKLRLTSDQASVATRSFPREPVE